MKSIQKLILPALIIAAILLLYFYYFKPTEELGLFSNFDPNNSANKDIRVSVVHSKGVDIDPQGSTASFFAADRQGVEYPVSAPMPLPNGFEESKSISMTGHLHNDYFHAVSITVD